jgi:hypothetical protein
MGVTKAIKEKNIKTSPRPVVETGPYPAAELGIPIKEMSPNETKPNTAIRHSLLRLNAPKSCVSPVSSNGTREGVPADTAMAKRSRAGIARFVLITPEFCLGKGTKSCEVV